MPATGLLDKRLVFVTGKGGVGKSTVAAALGLRAARSGRRTVVAEIGGRGDVGRFFGARPAAAASERELAPGLFTLAVEPRRALEEYLADQLPTRALAALVGASRSFGLLTAATPGLSELLCMGQVWELAQPQRRTAGARPYDLVVLDAPASGHGIGLLGAPRTFSRAAQVGPIARQAARIHASLLDPLVTGVVAVARPQEAAVNETLETRARLVGELGLAPGRVVVNAVRPRRFGPRDVPRLREALAGAATAAERRGLELALAEERRVRGERAQLRRLGRALGEWPIELPFVYALELGPQELDRLGDELVGAA